MSKNTYGGLFFFGLLALVLCACSDQNSSPTVSSAVSTLSVGSLITTATNTSISTASVTTAAYTTSAGTTTSTTLTVTTAATTPNQVPSTRANVTTAPTSTRATPAVSVPAPMTSGLPTPATGNDPKTGIQEANPPYKAAYAVMVNQWTGYVNTKLVTIYAGHFTEHPEQGLVTVQYDRPGDPTYKLIEYATPLKEGKVQITSVDNLILHLKTEKGSTFTFDYNSRQFGK